MTEPLKIGDLLVWPRGHGVYMVISLPDSAQYYRLELISPDALRGRIYKDKCLPARKLSTEEGEKVLAEYVAWRLTQ